MNEVTLFDVMRCDDQSEAPEGFVVYMGVDPVGCDELGKMCVYEFPVPEVFVDVVEANLELERNPRITFDWSGSQDFFMYGMPARWTRISPVFLTFV